MILTWTEKLINTRKRKLLVFLLFLISNTSIAFCTDLFQAHPLSLGNYRETLESHMNEIKRLDETRSWDDELSRYQYFEALLSFVHPMNDQENLETLTSLLVQHEKVFSETEDKFYKYASEVLAQSFKLGGGMSQIRLFKT